MMDQSPLLTIVIPSYNEEASLPSLMEELLPRCQAENWLVILVNDGSRDNSKAILETFTKDPVLTVFHHKVNRGYGGAIKTGIKKVKTPYCVTIDADGQHDLNDVSQVLAVMIEKDADLIVGDRGKKSSGWFREIGKSIIRKIAKIMMPLEVYDLNSGFKMYNTPLAQKYIDICPSSMAFSDVMTLIFTYQRNLVIEVPINIKDRLAGESTIGIKTAIGTVIEIFNIVTLFNPLKIFLPISLFFFLVSLIWAIPIIIAGRGLSVGALFGIITSILLFLLGLIAEQLGNIRRLHINKD